MDDLSQGLSVGQVARRLELSPGRIHQLIASGRLRAVRTALGWIVDPESVDDLVAQRAGRG